MLLTLGMTTLNELPMNILYSENELLKHLAHTVNELIINIFYTVIEQLFPTL